jgi:hypothetical protein
MASTLIHAIMLIAFADFFDLKYLHAKRKFKRRIFYEAMNGFEGKIIILGRAALQLLSFCCVALLYVLYFMQQVNGE